MLARNTAAGILVFLAFLSACIGFPSRPANTPVLPGSSRSAAEPELPGLLISSYCRRFSRAPFGQRASSLQYDNLQAWARTQGYDLLYRPFDIDSRFPRAWNKWLVLSNLLSHPTTRKRPWLLWVDGDVLQPNISRRVETFIHSHMRGNCSILLDGERDVVMKQKDYHDGLNAGIVIVRPTEWVSQHFLPDLLSRVLDPEYRTLLGDAAAQCTNPMCGRLSDQLVLGYLFANEWQAHVGDQICFTMDWQLQAHWRDVLQGRKNSMNITELFLHFAGCKFCEEFPEKKPRSENLQECIQQLEQVAQTTMRMRG